MISLNHQLFKNISHVGSFQNFVFVFAFVFAFLRLCLEVDSGCHVQGHLSLYTLAQGTRVLIPILFGTFSVFVIVFVFVFVFYITV